MTRNEFFEQLHKALAGLPQSEVNRITEYYDEIFSGALDDGKSEEEICASLDSPEDIAGRVRAEIAFVRAEQEQSPKSMSTVLIVLLGIFALPIGLPIAISVFAVVFSLLVVVFSVVVSLGAAVFALFAGGLVGIVYAITLIIQGSTAFGMASLGASFAFVGIGTLGGIGIYHLFRILFRAFVRCCRGIYTWVRNRPGRKRKGVN